MILIILNGIIKYKKISRRKIIKKRRKKKKN
jgi:hypothetical protein